MSVLQPTVGELADRQTILELKVHHGRAAGVETSMWASELHEIEERLAKGRTGFTAEEQHLFTRLFGTLRSINASLWVAEDEVRAMPESELAALAALAKRIANLNDQRAQSVRELNRLAGENVTGNEKVYAAAKHRAR